MTVLKRALLALAVTATLATAVYALTNRFNVDESGAQVCIRSNGIPDHEIGQFPNRGNPHSISAQSINFCVTASPEIGRTAREDRATGIGQGAYGLELQYVGSSAQPAYMLKNGTAAADIR